MQTITTPDTHQPSQLTYSLTQDAFNAWCAQHRFPISRNAHGAVVLDARNSNDVRHVAFSPFVQEMTRCHSRSGAEFLNEVIALRHSR